METILLSTADNNVQASLLQSALRNEGIESFLRNEHLSTVFGNIPGFQIEIYVFESDYEKAKEVLKNGFPELVGDE
ncbi:DUF2007 domain-containing protein [Parabacteroides sp. AM58-2XD]|jgi:hypothetical protein|uniref:DUF2007 domain-containing protein n=1 Tax=Parabacteroides segnis TaxID=2763058 RepID=A0ABR7E0K1_9BACT|nr:MULTISPECIES: DUF2007 domain-containing protein [Parabacteroides]MBC5643301.1 DUF2007 domain-containing protein [Parabacteroides segnis]MBS1321015.1 DUF2007 domain-containing protein [Parabacteroides sp.]MCM0712901.1 DUF2007 domain-containing protein [Parabacteroides sp. TA-V-105]RGY92788.1 DUF2007 domain-containing protein [Parabacteroides sp. AM58-2XD]GKG75212.1 hypothetical protein CE91St1_43550 [Parabacteroides goldsteinii]